MKQKTLKRYERTLQREIIKEKKTHNQNKYKTQSIISQWLQLAVNPLVN